MQVRELIEALQRMPPDAVVAVTGQVIHGTALRRGRLEVGYYNQQFTVDPKGKAYAVVFLANHEISTGEVISAPI